MIFNLIKYLFWTYDSKSLKNNKLIYFLYNFSNFVISSLKSLPLLFNLLLFFIIGTIHQTWRPKKINTRINNSKVLDII